MAEQPFVRLGVFWADGLSKMMWTSRSAGALRLTLFKKAARGAGVPSADGDLRGLTLASANATVTFTLGR